MNTREQNEAEIRHLEQAYDDAWNSGDSDALMALFSSDPVVVNPFGKVSRGRAEIRELLGKFLSGPGRGSRHTSSLSMVEFVTDDVAVVDGEARLEGLSGPAFPESTYVHRFSDIVVWKDGRWSIAQIRAYVFSAGQQ